MLSDRVEDANQILLDAEVNTALAPADPEVHSTHGLPMELRLIALGVVVVLVALWIVRLARVF